VTAHYTEVSYLLVHIPLAFSNKLSYDLSHSTNISKRDVNQCCQITLTRHLHNHESHIRFCYVLSLRPSLARDFGTPSESIHKTVYVPISCARVGCHVLSAPFWTQAGIKTVRAGGRSWSRSAIVQLPISPGVQYSNHDNVLQDSSEPSPCLIICCNTL
jgi:hypothetical protein